MSRFLMSTIAFVAYFYFANAAYINRLIIGGKTAPIKRRTIAEFADEDYQQYFTKEWRKDYDHEKLAKQPKWVLAEEQPDHGRYEVREYAPAWWVTSYTPCYDLVNATQMGYLRLYSYMQFGLNSKSTVYDLTYPILNKVEIHSSGKPDGKLGGMVRDPCLEKYSVNLYMPYYTAGDMNENNNPAVGHDKSISTSETPVTKRYVRTYPDEFTDDSPEVCAINALELASYLRKDKKAIDANTFYCAMYEYGKDGGIRFEVWYDDNNR